MIKNQVVVITGGSAGLGLALSRRLFQLGYRVYAGYHSQLPKSSGIRFIKLDVRDDQSCRRFVRQILRFEDRIDVLINCAGLSQVGDTLEFKAEDFINILNVNLIGPFRVIKEVVPVMSGKNGKIINITSMNSYLALPHSGLYSASKFGLDALGSSIRQELYSKKIKVTNIAPGFFVAEDSEPKKPILRKLFPYTTRDMVVKKIIMLIEHERYPVRYIIGYDAFIAYMLVKLLPSSLLDRLFGFLWNRNGTLALRK